MAAVPADIDDRVYRAVVAKKSVEEVCRLIEELAQGDDARRESAVNQAGTKVEEDNDSDQEEEGVGEELETPLEAAVGLDEGGLVAALLLAGADVSRLYDGEATALGLCCKYGQADGVRALLAAGHDVNERSTDFWKPAGARRVRGLTAAHVCASFRHVSLGQASQLDCLRVLVKEGGADINARDEHGEAPLHWEARQRSHQDARSAVDALVSLGADVEARDNNGVTPLCVCAQWGDHSMLSALLAAGASANMVTSGGMSPLILAAVCAEGPTRRWMVEELLRWSSDETRRAFDPDNDFSAIDGLVIHHCIDETHTKIMPFQPWHLRVVAELRRSGANVQPQFAAALLPSAAQRGAELDAELAERRSDSRRWRAHECFVQLAFDDQEVKEAERGVEARRERVSALEGELDAREDELAEQVAALEQQLRQRDAEIEQLRRAAAARGHGAGSRGENGEREEQIGRNSEEGKGTSGGSD